MKSERDGTPNTLNETDRGTLRRMFTRQIPVSQNVIRLDDKGATRKFLNEFRQHEEKQKKVAIATNGFNPDVHVVVTKEQLDITEQLQALTVMAKQVEQIQNVFVKPKKKPKGKRPTRQQKVDAVTAKLFR